MISLYKEQLSVTLRSSKKKTKLLKVLCHPFFTGKQKFVDAGGRVDKFKKRLQGTQK